MTQEPPASPRVPDGLWSRPVGNPDPQTGGRAQPPQQPTGRWTSSPQAPNREQRSGEWPLSPTSEVSAWSLPSLPPPQKKSSVPVRVAAVAAAILVVGVLSSPGEYSPRDDVGTGTTLGPPAVVSSSAAVDSAAAAAPVACTQPCVNVDGLVLTVSDVVYGVTSTDGYFQPEAGNVFVSMNITVVNRSGKSQSVTEFGFKLQDGTGVSRDAERAGTCESWQNVDVADGATFGPKCLSFDAAAGVPTGLSLLWSYDYVNQVIIELS